MLDSRQLRYFLAVAEDLHFGRAAERLHVAQSAVSAQIARLERDLGVRLIDRGKRAAVMLTDAGKRFQEEARLAYYQLENAERIGRQLGRGELGDLDIGYVASAALCGLLSRWLAAFRSTHPEVNVRLLPMETPRQLTALADGTIDIGFIRPRPSYPTGIASRIVHRERLMLAMSKQHALAASTEVTLADIGEQTFIIPQFEEAVGFTEHLATFATMAGVRIRQEVRVGDFMTALALADAGYGIAFVPSSSSNLKFGNLLYRDLDGFDDEVRLAIAWRSSQSTASVAAFLAADISRTLARSTGEAAALP